MTDETQDYSAGTLRERLAAVGRRVDEVLATREQDRKQMQQLQELAGRLDERQKSAVERLEKIESELQAVRAQRDPMGRGQVAGLGATLGVLGGFLGGLIRGLLMGSPS